LSGEQSRARILCSLRCADKCSQGADALGVIPALTFLDTVGTLEGIYDCFSRCLESLLGTCVVQMRRRGTSRTDG
jgi:hypothetical protein